MIPAQEKIYKLALALLIMNNKERGNVGEEEIVKLVPCPNCGKKLMKLPKNYPLVDVQCEGCTFRAQVKTVNSSPKKIIFGAGWK